MYCINVLFLIMQVPITLLEYTMNAVTEGIDAIASTRVSICSEDDHNVTNGSTGQTLHRTFRYEIYTKCCLPLSPFQFFHVESGNMEMIESETSFSWKISKQ